MTTTVPPPTPSPHGAPSPSRPTSVWTFVLVPIVAVIGVFWVWALFFASKEAVNKIDDRAWTERAEAICVDADAARAELVDLRQVDEGDAAMLAERGALIDRATDIVERMLDDVVAVSPTDAKGLDIVPRWEDDYRRYVADRRAYSDRLRAGDSGPFTETATDGIPISEKVATFAVDNEMPTCSPPIDLTL